MAFLIGKILLNPTLNRAGMRSQIHQRASIKSAFLAQKVAPYTQASE